VQALGEKRLYGFGERSKPAVRPRGALLGTRLLSLRIAFEKDGSHAQALAKLDVRKRIAHHHAGLGCDLGEIPPRLLKHARQRLSAVAFILVVGAKVDGIGMRTVSAEQGLKFCVHGLYIRGRV
jgi:hypothetical protein